LWYSFNRKHGGKETSGDKSKACKTENTKFRDEMTIIENENVEELKGHMVSLLHLQGREGKRSECKTSQMDDNCH
jgi:hypothetical protein